MADDLSQTMPMGRAAALPLDSATLLGAIPMKRPGMGAPPPAAAGLQGPPPAPAGAPQGPPGFPPPGAPNEPPYEVVLQPDGSSIYQLPSPAPGMPPIVLGVNPAPKLPAALQKAAQPPPQ